MPPPNGESTIGINYIRVDYKRRIFQETYPGRVILSVGSEVDDIVGLVREKMPSLKTLGMSKIKVYRLKNPLKRLPEQPSEVVQRSSRHPLKVKNEDEEAFDTFKGQIETFGIHTDFLEIAPLSLKVFDHFRPCGGDISTVIYHPKLAEDYEDIDEVRVEDQIHKIEEHDTPKTARIYDLKQLTKTAPWDIGGRDQLDHVFMGHPYSHHAFHVALYDPILALLAYKLEKIDVHDSEAKKIFPDAKSLRHASRQFLVDLANDYNTGKDRSDAAFVWIKKIFPNCAGQFCVEESENSTNSRRPMASAIADGAVCTSLGTSATGGEKPAAGTNEDPTAVVVHEIPNDHTKVLPAIIKVKNGSGDPVLQCAKYFGRHILSLEKSPIFENTNFPTILLTVEGSQLRVAILVNNGATIIKELILFHVYGSEELDCVTIMRLERIASALKACSEQLIEYYDGLLERKRTSPSLSNKIRFPQPTLDPTTSFPLKLESALESSKAFKRLRIKSFLQGNDDGPLDFIKKDESPRKRARIMRGLFIADGLRDDETRVEIVIKFSSTYNSEAHNLLAEKHHAPKLYECRRILGGMYMIVMDRVKGKQWSSMDFMDITDAMEEDLKCVVRDLHDGGFVHGDLRQCNVMVGDDGKVKVIDFDWAAKVGEGYYPRNINAANIGTEWHAEVEAGEMMTQDHDIFARDVLISKRKGPSDPSESTTDS